MTSGITRRSATLSAVTSLRVARAMVHTVHSLVDRYSSAASFQMPSS